MIKIHEVADQELIELFPVQEVERVVGGAVTWKILRTKSAITKWNLTRYNTCISTDAHRRYGGVENPNNPLHKYYEQYWKTPSFAGLLNYSHNQIVIIGKSPRGECASLHIAPVYKNSLYLNDIELQNPGVKAANPMDIDQKFAGLGNGIFPEIISRLRKFAGRHGMDDIIAFGADEVRANIFIRKGFRLDNRDQFLYRTWFQVKKQAPLVCDAIATPPTS